MKEIEIKIKLIEYLLEHSSSDTVIGSELRFNYGSRRADVVSITNNIASIFEIKGSGDSIERLEYQLDSYKEYFDYCYVVCEPSNIKLVKKNCKKKIGIILVENNDILLIKEASHFKKNKKITLASTLDTSTLRKLTSNNTLKSKHELCELFIKNNDLETVKNISRKHLREKLKCNFDIFYNELGLRINPDDILTLTRMPSGNLSKRA
ncbi:sce7726 family protein [Yersinia massiliensis]|uniref:Protein cII n=1 Tax=Yersinia massiliensis TaxID=419257 RepID=A0ABM6UNR4_9GAMM|nr:sce7726 family protein [Yersinia massiliensis]AVX36651.1 protein cII [Yersinia massiliensis]QKJ11455.1 sce7726 family protein [Yersinia massiliensis]